MSGLGLTFLRRGGQAHPTAGSDYLMSERKGDQAVFQVLMSKGVSSDGVGITKEDVANIQYITQWFKNNTTIQYFNELRFFLSLKSIGDNYAVDAPFLGCTSLREVTLPDGCKTIGRDAFNGCKSLSSLDGLDNVEAILENGLSGCGALTYEVLNLRNLTQLQTNALKDVPIRILKLPRLTASVWANSSSCNYGAKNVLEEVHLSESVPSIYNYSFFGYTALRNVILNASSPPTLGAAAFDGTSCNIYVPDASVETYKGASGWSSLASRIKPLSEYNG